MIYSMAREGLDTWLRLIALGIEILAVAILVAGALIATVIFVRDLQASDSFDVVFHRYRAGLARSLLLAVELLVAADLIGTVVVEPTLENLAVLGFIVLIRTFLSFSLEVELEGRLPWRRSRAGKAPGSEATTDAPDAP